MSRLRSESVTVRVPKSLQNADTLRSRSHQDTLPMYSVDNGSRESCHSIEPKYQRQPRINEPQHRSEIWNKSDTYQPPAQNKLDAHYRTEVWNNTNSLERTRYQINHYTAEPMHNSWSTEPRPNSQPADSRYNSQPAEPRYNSQPADPRYNSQPADSRYNSQPAEPRYNSQPADPRYNSQPAEPRYNSRPVNRRGEPVYSPHEFFERFGSKGPKKGKSRKIKSSGDLHQDEVQPNASPQTLSRRKRFWKSFRKLRVRSKDSTSKSTESLNGSQQDFGTANGRPKKENFDAMFDANDQKHGPSRSMSDPTLTPRISTRRTDSGDVDSGIAVVENSNSSDSTVRNRDNVYLQHPFFQLEVVLKEGRDLVVKDSCGTSDPYVKFKVGGKQFFKSRTVFKNLNPKWDERFTIPIDDIYKPVNVKVYDYDRGVQDDPMGSAEIDLTTIDLNVATDLKLMLTEKKSDYMGYLLLSCTLSPKTQADKENYFKKGSKVGDAAKKMKQQIWSSVVTVVLVEGSGLVPMDDNGRSDPYVKFKLGNEKYKSKHKSKTLNPRWLEQFDLHMFNDQTSHMDVMVYDHDVAGKDDFMGRAVIDLSAIEREKTHTLDQELEDGAGVVKMLLTISGTSGNETISDLANYTPLPTERQEVIKKYSAVNSFKAIKDVGWLQVKVFKAQSLASADIGGKSDPFCVIELVNSRLQTQTEYKTLTPDWNKVFTFNVKDIHSILEVTVYDEDRDKKVEFLGKIAIPIIKIKNGDRKWYVLKDKKLMRRAKGAVLLEMDFVFNNLKSAIRTVNPREEKYMQPEQKFKISIMKRNIDRVSQIAASFVEGGKFIQSCFDWESKPRSLTAFIVFLLIVWNFELYLLPITLLVVFVKNLIVAQVLGALSKDHTTDVNVEDDDDDDEDDKDKTAVPPAANEITTRSRLLDVQSNRSTFKTISKEEKKSFKEKLLAIQEVCLQVQQGMDMVASMGERIKNTFNWTVPWLTMLAVIVMTIGGVVLYLIPLRVLIMLWGINKFTKKLRAPNAIPNNELMDFLSRVPSDSELIQHREFRPEVPLGATSSKKKRA